MSPRHFQSFSAVFTLAGIVGVLLACFLSLADLQTGLLIGLCSLVSFGNALLCELIHRR